jgi:hypothetical protein
LIPVAKSDWEFLYGERRREQAVARKAAVEYSSGEEDAMTIQITDPGLLEQFSRAGHGSPVKGPEGLIIGTFTPTPRKVERLEDLSPFTDEELARRREEVRKNPVGRPWSEIRKDLEAMG